MATDVQRIGFLEGHLEEERFEGELGGTVLGEAELGFVFEWR